MKGKTVSAFTFGSKALYDFVDHNEDMYFMPFPVVNDPVNIAKNDNMISTFPKLLAHFLTLRLFLLLDLPHELAVNCSVVIISFFSIVTDDL